MKTEKKHEYRHYSSCLVVLLLFLVGCASKSEYPMEGTVLLRQEQPKAHLWQHLFSLQDEEAGYATYSYVLTGRDEKNRESSSLYLELIDAIKRSTPNAGALRNSLSRRSYNIFLIPVVKSDSTDSLTPDYERSKQFLATLSASSSQQFTRPGPYIITLCEPIGAGKREVVADVLYLDLTGVHPDALAEFVRTYKNHLTSEPVEGIERLKSLRLSLLNLALVTEESIGFAKTAYAALQDVFPKESPPEPAAEGAPL
jgi:hypothetical protein